MKVRKLLSAIIAGAMVLCTMSFSVFADGEYTFDVDSASSLKTALNKANSANGQAVTINIKANIDAAGTEYAFNWNGATAESSQNLTINGNGYAISNMTTPLISSIWHGDILTINDLTINSANITIPDSDDNGQSSSAAAFVAHIEASDYVTFNRCKLTNSTVSGGHWNGGFVGYAAGYSKINDGAVFTEITFNNCEVLGNTLSSKGSVGGLMGHAMGSTWTKVNIINTSIFSNRITCTGTSIQKAGAICGTIGCAGIEENGKTGGMIIDTTKLANNTVKSNDVEISTFYGRQGDSTGVASIINKTLIVDSEVYTDNADFVQNLTYAAKIGNNYYATLADAVAAAQDGETITFVADSTETNTVTISDKNVTINFDGHTLNGSIKTTGTSNVTIENGYIRQEGSVSGIEVAGNSNVTINNMDVESFRHAIRVDADDDNCVATAVINGGKYVSTNNNNTCHGINIGSAHGKSVVTINGGEFYGPVNNASGGNSLMIQNNEDDVKIYGGYFAEASGPEGCICPAAGLKIYGTNSPKFETWGYDRFIADGYKLIRNDDGTYGVAEEEKTEPEILKKSLYVTYSQLGKYDFGSGMVDSIKLSLLGGIDSLNYSEVGFDVTLNGKTQTFPVTVVYDSVKVNMNGEVQTINASEFGKGVNHIFGQTINFPATEEFKDASVEWVPYAIRNKVKITGNKFNLTDIFPRTLEVK